jgi:hypothetical protein
MIPTVTAPGTFKMIPGDVAHAVYQIHGWYFLKECYWFNALSTEQ